MIDTDLLAHIISMNTGAGSRVHLESPPQEDLLPLVVLRRSGGDQPNTTTGRKLWERSGFEINVLGQSHSQSYPIMAAIRAQLHGFKGMIGTTRVHECRCVSFPDHITEIDGDNRRRWITSQFRFLHSEG
jgi:hypothetical protein